MTGNSPKVLHFASGLLRWLTGRIAGSGTSPSGSEIEPDSGLRIYAVGDIHGRHDLLLRIESLIRQEIADNAPQRSCLIYLGDFVDRGPDSKAVIDHLIRRPPICTTEVFLRGNHEQVFLDFLSSPAVLEEWATFGGLETLVSYGLRPKLPLPARSFPELQQAFRAALPDSHRAFLESTKLCFVTGGYFFAHAGVNPQRPLDQQLPSDLLWIRDEFLQSNRRFSRKVVHGHTPVIKAEIHPNRINVDTGAYLTGRLSCAVIDGHACRFIDTLA